MSLKLEKVCRVGNTDLSSSAMFTPSPNHLFYNRAKNFFFFFHIQVLPSSQIANYLEKKGC